MDIAGYMASRKKTMLAVLQALVRLESPTGNKRAVDACSKHFVRLASGRGRDVMRIPQRDIGDFYLVGRPGLFRSEAKPIMLLTHTDTVWPVGRLKDMPWRVSGSKVFGPGALDMKGGLVAALFALKALDELKLQARRPALLFINSAEETGHPIASRWIRQLARKAACVLCLEPALPGGALKVRRKGRLVIRLQARGRAAHAGSPRCGVNAIEELMGQVAALRGLRTKGRTMNIGLVSGGTEANVVPDRAEAVLDFRFWSKQDADRILRRLEAMTPLLPGARVSHDVQSLTPPMERSPASRELFGRASRIAAGLGQRLKAGETGGGSDASLAADLGLPALDGLGPDGDGIHAANEHVLLPSLVERAALLAALLAGL